MSSVLMVVNGQAISQALGEMIPISFWAEPAKAAAEAVQTVTEKYPPERPSSGYVRTFELQNGWDSRVVLRGGVLAVTESKRPDYNIWVKDQKQQAFVHRGWWDTIEDDAQTAEPEVIQIYDDYVQTHWGEVS